MDKEGEINKFLQETVKSETNIRLDTLFFSSEETIIKEEKYIYNTEKNQIPLSVSVSTFHNQSKDSFHKVCVIYDQSLYEELETSKMEAKYQKNLFAMINHELRNPLHGILGIFDIILSIFITGFTLIGSILTKL